MLAALAGGRPAAAQQPETGAGPRLPAAAARVAGAWRLTGETNADSSSTSLFAKPWLRPVASLVVPGSGQLLARQERGVVYLATEVWALVRFLARRSEGRREREHYQELAFRVARQRFASGPRRDGPFTYYETMSEFAESGEFDLDPGPGFAPETDTTTFNGATWALAQRTFFPDPDNPPAPGTPAYQAALAFYAQRAVSGDFRWSWRGARLEQDVFRAAIRGSDEAFRAATNYLGVVVLNHLASTVDALITSRVRRQGVVPQAAPGPDGASLVLAWHLTF